MAQTAQLRHLEVVENEAQRIFNLQRAAYLRHPYPTSRSGGPISTPSSAS